jgi:DNA ligase 1
MVDKPMKASDYEEAELHFPYLASAKLDGYRAFSSGGSIRTSSGTPITNVHTRTLFSGELFTGLDGELIVGDPWDRAAFHNTSGPVRRATGMPDIHWHIFDDRTNPDLPFRDRINAAKRRVDALRAVGCFSIDFVEHYFVATSDEMSKFESAALAKGYEGIMLRDPDGRYKFGRSTVKENLLLKVKRYVSEEATIIDLEEQVENTNASGVDAFGHAKKSTSKATQIGTGMVGAFVVRSDKWPTEFRISASSLSHDNRRKAWDQRGEYIGELARFKYFPHGVVDVPRHGVFEAIRDRADV